MNFYITHFHLYFIFFPLPTTNSQFKNYKDYSADINSVIGELGNLPFLTSL